MEPSAQDIADVVADLHWFHKTQGFSPDSYSLYTEAANLIEFLVEQRNQLDESLRAAFTDKC